MLAAKYGFSGFQLVLSYMITISCCTKQGSKVLFLPSRPSESHVEDSAQR